MKENVLVIGSTCVDVILRVDHLPKTEENIHPRSQRFAIGGCAYNVANILGRGGADMVFVTPVGRLGVFGGFVRDHLAQLGFADMITHISTGGGATLEFLGGEVLPGVACLLDKE